MYYLRKLLPKLAILSNKNIPYSFFQSGIWALDVLESGYLGKWGAIAKHIHLLSIQEGTEVLPISHAAALALTVPCCLNLTWAIFSLIPTQPFCNLVSGMTSHYFCCIPIVECSTPSGQGLKMGVSAKRPFGTVSIRLPEKIFALLTFSFL